HLLTSCSLANVILYTKTDKHVHTTHTHSTVLSHTHTPLHSSGVRTHTDAHTPLHTHTHRPHWFKLFFLSKGTPPSSWHRCSLMVTNRWEGIPTKYTSTKSPYCGF